MASRCDVGFGRHPAGITQLLRGCMEVMDVLCLMEVLWKLYSLYSKKVTSLTILGCMKFIPAFMPALPRKRSLEDGNQPASKWRIRLGDRAKGIRNPIREIMDTIAGKAPVTMWKTITASNEGLSQVEKGCLSVGSCAQIVQSQHWSCSFMVMFLPHCNLAGKPIKDVGVFGARGSDMLPTPPAQC